MTTADNIEALYSPSYAGDMGKAHVHAARECVSFETDTQNCTLYTFPDGSALLVGDMLIEVRTDTQVQHLERIDKTARRERLQCAILAEQLGAPHVAAAILKRG